MDKNPLVTIVTPSYNQAAFLEETIQSVLSQDYANLEYIIVDGGSTDGSIDIIKKYQDRLAAWVSEPDQGQSDAINKGFLMSSGEIMAWLNSDDIYHDGAIREMVSVFQENPDLGLLYSDLDIIDVEGRTIGKFNTKQSSYRRLMRGGVNIPQPAAFWRRSIWERTGPLDISFYFAMDYDLWVRIAKIAPVKYVPFSWASFRLHEEGKTSVSDDRCWPEMRRVHRREKGRLISWFMAKYTLRKIIGPAWPTIKNKLNRWQSFGDGNE